MSEYDNALRAERTHVLPAWRKSRINTRGDHSTTRHDLSRQVPLGLKDHMPRQFSDGNHIGCFLELDTLRIEEFTLVVYDDPWIQSAVICSSDIRAVK
jgi:hypothetical protein